MLKPGSPIKSSISPDPTCDPVATFRIGLLEALPLMRSVCVLFGCLCRSPGPGLCSSSERHTSSFSPNSLFTILSLPLASFSRSSTSATASSEFSVVKVSESVSVISRSTCLLRRSCKALGLAASREVLVCLKLACHRIHIKKCTLYTDSPLPKTRFTALQGWFSNLYRTKFATGVHACRSNCPPNVFLSRMSPRRCGINDLGSLL